MQWVYYELHRTPRVLKLLRAELDEVFGPDSDPAKVEAILLSKGEDVLRRLNYTSAVIKEALRLYPPAGTARKCQTGSGFNVKLADGRELCLDGYVLYNCQYIIHRDPAVFGETADEFIPERWTGDVDTSAMDSGETAADSMNGTIAAVAHGAEQKVPPTSWRPFERGPRNCIGQELANLEARVILAMTVRRYDFTKVGSGELELDGSGKPVLQSNGQYKVASQTFNVSRKLKFIERS